MKLNTTSAPVEVVGNTSNSNFSIAVNGKAFRVLSDTLYKNKIGSIVREISCNAYDAHVMAGKKDVPFTVHLPDDFEPWFSVQDQGVGLSPDDISNVFTVYFQSTKDQSNDAIGAFGLGAKTPFSYTDQFTVTSVKDGMKRMYSAYITPEGIPNIAEMHAEETIEENGVEIRMAVKREDYAKFKSEVFNQLKYFKVKPRIENGTVEFKEEEAPIFQVNSCDVFQRGGYSRDSSFIILQGNVGYDLDWNVVRTSISEQARTFADRLMPYKTILKFDIGQIGVTASREGVEYDNTTLRNIENRLLEMQKECTEFVAEQIKELTTEYDKALFIHSNDIYSRLTNYKFKDGFNLVNHGASAMIQLPTEFYFTLFQKNNGKLRKSYLGLTPSIHLNRIKNTTIVIKDADTVGRLNRRVSEVTADYGYSLLIVPSEGQTVDEIVEKLVVAQGGYSENIKIASKITLPKIQRDAHKVSTFYKIGFNDQSLRFWHKVTDEVLEEIEDETIYTTSFGMDFEDLPSIQEYRSLCSIDSSIPKLISVKKSDVEKAEANSNLIPLKEFIVEKRKEFEANLDSGLKRRYIRYGFPDDAQRYIPYRMHNFLVDLRKHAPTSDLTRAFNLTTMKDKKNLTESEINLCRFMGLDADRAAFRTKRLQRIELAVSKLNKKYPLVEAVFEGYNHSQRTAELAKYVNMVYHLHTS